MPIGNRLFPYPVLNSTELYSSYNSNCSFNLVYDDGTYDGDYLILPNLYCIVQSDFLVSLIQSGRAEIKMLFECPETMYRRLFPISMDPADLRIPIGQVNGICYLSAFVVATEDIAVDPDSNDFIDEVADVPIVFEKHDILAVDEGHKHRIDFDLSDDIKKSSPFKVVPVDDYLEGKMTVDWGSDIISIQVSKNAFDAYRASKVQSSLNNIYFSMLVVPALIYSIESLLRDYSDKDSPLDEASFDYLWFRSFIKSFERKYNREFNLTTDLDQLDDIVQNLFDYPCGKGVVLLSNMATPEGGSEDDD